MMALTLKEQRENVRVIAGSRNLTIYSAVKVWAQATELLRDRVITLSNLGAEIGDRLELSREIDRSWFDLLIRNAWGHHLACLTASACRGEFIFTESGWQLARLFKREPDPTPALDEPEPALDEPALDELALDELALDEPEPALDEPALDLSLAERELLTPVREVLASPAPAATGLSALAS